MHYISLGPGPSVIVPARSWGDDAPPEGQPDMYDRTEVLELCTRSRSSNDTGMKMQIAIEEDALPGGDVDSSHVKVMVKAARGTAGDCKCIKKYRFTVKGPASCRSGCCRGT